MFLNLKIYYKVLFQWLCPSIRTFTTEFRRKFDIEFCFGRKRLKPLLFTQKIPIKIYFSKFQFECVFLELANKKNSNHFKFRKIGGFTGSFYKRVL